MPSLVWCPPVWCCGNLYFVPDTGVWRCPYSGVKAHTVLTESDWLAWSEPRSMRRLFAGRRRKLDLLTEGARRTGLEGLLEPGPEDGTPDQRKRLCDFIRDIFGNPFRPLPPISPTILAWSDSIAVKLAAQIYVDQDFSPERMGVLADALEEAGVTDQDVLQHLRGPRQAHVRGCVALDLLLGKE